MSSRSPSDLVAFGASGADLCRLAQIVASRTPAATSPSTSAATASR